MNASDRSARRQEIQAAAMALLDELGYRKTSMLMIARRAQASNQTLYAWYQNKQMLFRDVILAHGQAVSDHLVAALRGGDDPLQALAELGPHLLSFTTDRNAVIMNRAAVVDAAETGVLAKAIDEVGRDRIYPLIRALMQRLVDTGVFASDTPADHAAQTYVALLFGELQFRQALGTVEPLDEKAIERQARNAYLVVCRLFHATSASRLS